MKFDFAAFFAANNIHFVTSGKNVAAGWVNIKCPLCGDDPSEHLGCDPSNGFWGCLRNKSHRGSTARLVQILKGCTYSEAVAIVGEDDQGVSGDSLEQLESTLYQKEKAKTCSSVEMPLYFKNIVPRGWRHRFWKYLRDERHFDRIAQVCRTYRLKACRVGDWKYRLIIPIYFKSVLVGWQGRAIGPAKLRYLTHPKSATAKRLLFNYDIANAGGRILTVVEGPIDAMKVDLYGSARGHHCVATLGTSFTEAQIGRIYRLAEKYDKLVLLFDPGAFAEVMELASRLDRFGPIVANVPDNRDDPGDFRTHEVAAFLESL